MKVFKMLASTAISFAVGVSILPAAEVNDVPLEEQLEMLQTRLWDVMNSTEMSSIQEFQDLLTAIAKKEKELVAYNANPPPPVVAKVTPPVKVAPPVVVEKIAPTVTTPMQTETLVASIAPQQSVTTTDVPAEIIAEYPQVFHKQVIVDKSNYTLSVYNDDKIIAGQRVIVGRPGRETPSFESIMTHVVFNPYWNVSQRIATVDLAPKFRTAPKDIIDRGFQVFESWRDDAKELDPLLVDWSKFDADHQVPYLVRQKPGPDNEVGQVKFMVKSIGPETNGIILHGSPRSGHNLFDTNVRQYSSGCVRVEDEVQLARLVLNHGGGYTEDQIQAIIDSGRTRWVKVKTPVKVIIK